MAVNGFVINTENKINYLSKKIRGAESIIALTGKIMTMPGLPKVANAEKIGIDKDGNIEGIF